MAKARLQAVWMAALLIVSVGVFSTWHHDVQHGNAKSEIDHALLSRSTDPATGDNPDVVETIQNDRDIRQRLVKLEAALATLQNTVSDLQQHVPQATLHGEPHSTGKVETADRSTSTAASATINRKDYIRRADEQFHAEAVDTDWAIGAEEKLISIYQSGQHPGIDVVSTQCKSTSCRMEYYFDNDLLQEKFLTSITLSSHMNFELLDNGDDNGRWHAILLFARKGYAVIGDSTAQTSD